MGWVLVGQVAPKSTGPGGSGGFSDSATFTMDYSLTELLPSLSDIYAFDSDANYSEPLATPGETLSFDAVLAEMLSSPNESRDSLIQRYASATATSGSTAPTNPANAVGPPNGTYAQCKVTGLASGTSTLALSIVAPMSEIQPGSSPTLQVYYQITTLLGDQITCTAAYRQMGQSSDTVVTMPITGNYFTVPHPVALVNINPQFPVVCTFTHATASPATSGYIRVDAMLIETLGAL